MSVNAFELPDQYPVHYRSLVKRGYRWQRLREAHAQTVIVWRHVDTQEILVTLTIDGRTEEFVLSGQTVVNNA